MLILPHAHDQFDNAARVVRLGCSRTIPRPRYTATTAITELQALLNDQRYAERAAEVGEIVRQERNDRGRGCYRTSLTERFEVARVQSAAVASADQKPRRVVRHCFFSYRRNPAALNLIMLLVIDIGNTNTSLGVSKVTGWNAHWRLTTARPYRRRMGSAGPQSV